MTMRPLVSVIIPSYNHGRFLHQTIQSVLGQTYSNLELIIIDDGSKDDSWAMIQAAAANDSRIRAYHQANQGAHAAINRGLALAQGEFLCILNSDDRYVPERLARLVELATTEHVDFIATGLRLIDADGQPITDDPWLLEYQRMVSRAQSDGLWAALLERNVTVSTSNFFFRKTLFDALGPIRPLRYNMDWDYVLRAYLANPNAFQWRFDWVLWEYRLHGKNTILGGLPVSAIEANHLVLRSLQTAHGVPAAALAGLRRHYKLIRQQQVTQIAAARDAAWEPEVHKAHAGWQQALNAYENTVKAYDATHAELGATLETLEQTRLELHQTRSMLHHAQRDLHRLRFSPLYLAMRAWRWWKRRQSTQSLPNPTTPPSAVAACAPIKPSMDDLRVAAHLHVYYEDIAPELLQAAATLPAQAEVFITTPHEPTALRALAHEYLGHLARIEVIQLPNQGKDVGPFIEVIYQFNLPSYDVVLKLHTKRSQNAASYLAVIRQLFGNDIVDGDDWRRKLIAPIAGNATITEQTLRRFISDPELGMIGARQFLCSAPDANRNAYAALCQRLHIATHPEFFGGTMFWIRGQVLQRFIDAGITFDDFSPTDQAEVENTLEHQLERVFGALVQSYGLTLSGQ
ncbi:glycosyltransferase [Paenalcaligenes hominis]|uniref:glycosyltransferase n=1 Tax=Paenalcaligenes hominis TaxID=643674 RepID=UPI003523B6EB